MEPLPQIPHDTLTVVYLENLGYQPFYLVKTMVWEGNTRKQAYWKVFKEGKLQSVWRKKKAAMAYIVGRLHDHPEIPSGSMTDALLWEQTRSGDRWAMRRQPLMEAY